MSDRYIKRERQAVKQRDSLTRSQTRREEQLYSEKQADRHADDKRCTEYEGGPEPTKFGKCK